MSNKTPSGGRKAGREAFIPGENPADHQPYKMGSFEHDMGIDDWMAGWIAADMEYEDKQKLESSKIDLIKQIRLEHSCSLQEAKRILDKKELLISINNAQSIGRLKLILLQMVDMI